MRLYIISTLFDQKCDSQRNAIIANERFDWSFYSMAAAVFLQLFSCWCSPISMLFPIVLLLILLTVQNTGANPCPPRARDLDGVELYARGCGVQIDLYDYTTIWVTETETKTITPDMETEKVRIPLAIVNN